MTIRDVLKIKSSNKIKVNRLLDLKKYFFSLYRCYLIQLYEKGYISDFFKLDEKELRKNIVELRINGLINYFGHIKLNTDFIKFALYKNSNALYYFDHPYLITQAQYNVSWSESDEKDLLSLLDTLNEKGIKFALSNVIESNGKVNKILKEWSKKYHVHYLNRKYLNSNYRKKNITIAQEVLITNY